MSALKKVKPLTPTPEPTPVLAPEVQQPAAAMTGQPAPPKAADLKQIIYRVTPAQHKQLKHMATDKETSVQKLLEHAVDLLLAQEGETKA